MELIVTCRHALLNFILTVWESLLFLYFPLWMWYKSSYSCLNVKNFSKSLHSLDFYISYICNIHFKSIHTYYYFLLVQWKLIQLLRSAQLDILVNNSFVKCWSLTGCCRGNRFYICSYVQTQQEVHVQWTSSLSHQAKCSDRVEQPTVGFYPHFLFYKLLFMMSNQQEQLNASVASISSHAL